MHDNSCIILLTLELYNQRICDTQSIMDFFTKKMSSNKGAATDKMVKSISLCFRRLEKKFSQDDSDKIKDVRLLVEDFP